MGDTYGLDLLSEDADEPESRPTSNWKIAVMAFLLALFIGLMIFGAIVFFQSMFGIEPTPNETEPDFRGLAPWLP